VTAPDQKMMQLRSLSGGGERGEGNRGGRGRRRGERKVKGGKERLETAAHFPSTVADRTERSEGEKATEGEKKGGVNREGGAGRVSFSDCRATFEQKLLRNVARKKTTKKERKKLKVDLDESPDV